MTRYIICCIVALLGISFSSYAITIDPNGNYWQCRTNDATDTYWESRNIYQKIALNFSYAQCKKNSKVPTTCRTSIANCEQFVSGVNIMPKWECTAFDRAAFAWKSNQYPLREDAALAAQAYCKHKSPIPETCSINMITCLNKQAI